ncbi:MAG: hypothetical protein R3E12_08275 [Candidatus Eisenbacteria bacterium]
MPPHLLEAFTRIDTDMHLVMAGGSSFSDGYVDSLIGSQRQAHPHVGVRLR